MTEAPALVLRFTLGGLGVAALLLWLTLNVGGPGALRDGVAVLSCMPDPDPRPCIENALSAPPPDLEALQ